MAYYKKCAVCGAALDPGERCDCRIVSAVKHMTPEEKIIARTPGAIIILEKRPGESIFKWIVRAG